MRAARAQGHDISAEGRRPIYRNTWNDIDGVWALHRVTGERERPTVIASAGRCTSRRVLQSIGRCLVLKNFSAWRRKLSRPEAVVPRCATSQRAANGALPLIGT